VTNTLAYLVRSLVMKKMNRCEYGPTSQQYKYFNFLSAAK